MSELTLAGLREIARPVEAELERVERLLAQLADPQVPEAQIGERLPLWADEPIRAALLLLSCRLCGADGDRTIRLAAVVELLHAALSLHETRDGSRRARPPRAPTSRAVRLLLGDRLYAQSLGLALAQDHVPAMRALSDATLSMIEGQLLGLARRAEGQLEPGDELQIARRVTGALFSASLRIGALLGEARPRRERALAGYGLELGVSFQLAGAAWGAPDRAAAQELRRLAERYAEAALRRLGSLDPSPCRDALERLPGFVLAR